MSRFACWVSITYVYFPFINKKQYCHTLFQAIAQMNFWKCRKSEMVSPERNRTTYLNVTNWSSQKCLYHHKTAIKSSSSSSFYMFPSAAHQPYLVTNLALRLHFAEGKMQGDTSNITKPLWVAVSSCLPLSLINNLNNRHSAVCLRGCNSTPLLWGERGVWQVGGQELTWSAREVSPLCIDNQNGFR